MREILFRAKRLDHGEWVEGSLITYKDGTAFICCEDYIPDVLNKYEGDKITMTFSHGQRTANVVSFQGGSFGLHWKRGGVGHFAAFTGICHVEYEVTGSIHDKEKEGRDHDTAESAEGM